MKENILRVIIILLIVMATLFAPLALQLIGWAWNSEQTFGCKLQGQTWDGNECYSQVTGAVSTSTPIWYEANPQLQDKTDTKCKKMGYSAGIVEVNSTTSAAYFCYYDETLTSSDVKQD